MGNYPESYDGKAREAMEQESSENQRLENYDEQDFELEGLDAFGQNLSITIENRTKASQVFAYITGQTVDNGKKVRFIKADGKTPFFPSSPS